MTGIDVAAVSRVVSDVCRWVREGATMDRDEIQHKMSKKAGTWGEQMGAVWLQTACHCQRAGR